MSVPMSFQEFADVVKYIAEYNSPFKRKPNMPVVKYIDPHFDMRTNSVFSITLRGYGTEVLFHTQNECRDLPETLQERIINYLTTPIEFDNGK